MFWRFPLLHSISRGSVVRRQGAGGCVYLAESLHSLLVSITLLSQTPFGVRRLSGAIPFFRFVVVSRGSFLVYRSSLVRCPFSGTLVLQPEGSGREPVLQLAGFVAPRTIRTAHSVHDLYSIKKPLSMAGNPRHQPEELSQNQGLSNLFCLGLAKLDPQ